MAHGICCKHCGWNETAHDEQVPEDWQPPLEGYKYSLANCPNFDPDDPELAQRLGGVEGTIMDQSGD